MRYINSKTYSIGTGAGQHPAGQNIVDSFIGLVSVGSITYNDQNYNTGLAQSGDDLNFSGASVTTANGTLLTVNFAESIQIGNLCD